MTEIQFNGAHLAIVSAAVIVAFAAGAVYGWLLCDERKEARDATR